MFGVINFLRGTMGFANAQRALNYIRIFTEFFSQPEWKDVVMMFGIMNEPGIDRIGDATMQSL
jgi:glucan 1,3-beta-glucosidase